MFADGVHGLCLSGFQGEDEETTGGEASTGAPAGGMPGLPGAIERVAIAENGTIDCRVIGGGVPEGICGSGLVDLLGELLRSGRINALGRFENGEERISVSPNIDHEIYLTESDINELCGWHRGGRRRLLFRFPGQGRQRRTAMDCGWTLRRLCCIELSEMVLVAL